VSIKELHTASAMARALIQQLDRVLGVHGEDTEEYQEEMRRPRDPEGTLELEIKCIKEDSARNDIYLTRAENKNHTAFADTCRRHKGKYERALRVAEEKLRALRAKKAAEEEPIAPREARSRSHSHANIKRSRSRSPNARGRRVGAR
jgi:hypothetical protein